MTSRTLLLSLTAAAGFVVLFANDNFSSTQQFDLIAQANARVGRPATPVSVAGVARRTERRAYRRGAVAAGAGAYYGGSYYSDPYYGGSSYYGSGSYYGGSYYSSGSYYGGSYYSDPYYGARSYYATPGMVRRAVRRSYYGGWR